MVFAWQGVCLNGNYLIMMHTQFYFTLIQIAYILTCRPFDSDLLMGLELMNEVTLMFSLYSVFLFNPRYVTEQSFVDYTGYFMMSIVILCMSVHLLCLVRTMGIDFISKIKSFRARCKQK